MATSSRDPGPGHHGAAAWSRLVWVCPGSGRRNARSVRRGSPGLLGGAAWQPGTPAPPWAQDAWALPGVRGQGIRGDAGAAPASSRAARLLAPVAREDEASLAEAGLCRVWLPVAKRVILQLFFSRDNWGKQQSARELLYGVSEHGPCFSFDMRGAPWHPWPIRSRGLGHVGGRRKEKALDPYFRGDSSGALLCPLLEGGPAIPRGPRAPAYRQAPPTAVLLGPGGTWAPHTRPRPPNAWKSPPKPLKGLFAGEALRRSHAAHRAEHEVRVKPSCGQRSRTVYINGCSWCECRSDPWGSVSPSLNTLCGTW